MQEGINYQTFLRRVPCGEVIASFGAVATSETNGSIFQQGV